MAADTNDRQQLLAEVRRRAGRRRQRRHRVVAGAAVLAVIAVLALAVHLSNAPGGGKKLQLVSPPGGATWTAGWTLSPGSPDEAIVGLETSACQGCTNGQACPLFTAAASAFLNQIGHMCPDVRPPSESVYPISSGVVGFQDPPGVSGEGRPSGGQNPANGVMTYYPGNPQGSWLDTCTLPTGEKDRCTAALNVFVTGYRHA
jgi:hypothetical protein